MIAKRLWIPLSFVLGTGLGAQELKPQDDGKQGEMEQIVATQGLRIELLEQDLQTVMDYLAAQAKSAQALGATIDQADKAGFAWGINPEAHTLVLDGIRALSRSIQKDVPGPKEAPEPEPTGRRRRRR
ncbi:MAG: hypothetical protein E2O39_01695 [Planctomycetota bacterium]|nr:MAG: hypothetical protein E2O39_01695 [Planctomycetota bacterium]